MMGAMREARESRIDPIGFTKELSTRHAEPLKELVKARMRTERLARVQSDYFEGLLVKSESASIDPVKVLALYEKKKLTRAQFLSVITVRKEPLDEVLGKDKVRKLCTIEPGTPRLTVSRLGTVEIPLVDALAQLSKSVK